MSKKYIGKKCVYCAEALSTSRDHVFAEEFFLSSERQGLPQVPACTMCNNDKSKLEHYLTTVLPFGGRHLDAKVNLETMVPNRLAKNRKLLRVLSEGWKKVWATENSGIHIPVSTLPLESGQIEKLFALIVRGLVWYHWKTFITKDHFVDVIVLTKTGEQYFEDNFFGTYTLNRINVNLGHGTLGYEGIQTIDRPEMSAWRFSMYGGLKFGDPEIPGEYSSRIGAITGPQSLKSGYKLRLKIEA